MNKFYMTRTRALLLILFAELPVLFVVINTMMFISYNFSFLAKLASKWILLETVAIEQQAVIDSRLCFLAVLPFVTFAMIRYIIDKKMISCIIHFIVWVAFIVVSVRFQTIEFILSCACVTFLLLYSIVSLYYQPDELKSLAEQKQARFLACIFLNGLIMFDMSYNERFNYGNVMFIFTIASFIFAVFYLHMQRLNENIDKLEYKMIDKSMVFRTISLNNLLIFVTVLIIMTVFALCLLSDFSGMKPLNWSVKVLNNLEEIRNIRIEDYEMVDKDFPERATNSHEVLPYSEPTEHIEWLPPNWISILMVVFIVVLFLFTLLKLYMNFIRYKKIVDNSVIRIENAKKETTSPTFKFPVFFHTPNEQVRRIFYMKVKEHMNKGLKLFPSSTSVKIASDISKNEDISELEDYYKLVRYSDDGVTKQDVARLKKKSNDSKNINTGHQL